MPLPRPERLRPKAEFDAVVTLVNELKAKHNKLVKQLATGKAT